MTIKATCVAIIPILAAVCFVTTSAMSEIYTINEQQKISIEGHSPDQVKSSCDGHYAVPNSQGTYFCVHRDGNAVACGGTGEESKKSCYIFRLDGQVLNDILATPSVTMSEKVPEDVFDASRPNRICFHCDRGFQLWCCRH